MSRRDGVPGPDPTRARPDEPDASRRAEQALSAQRERNEPDDDDLDDEGVGALVVNTGLDGDAATG